MHERSPLPHAEREQAAGDLARGLVPVGPGRCASCRLPSSASTGLAPDGLDAIVEHHDRVLHAERSLGRSSVQPMPSPSPPLRCLHECEFLREEGRAFNRMVLCDDPAEMSSVRVRDSALSAIFALVLFALARFVVGWRCCWLMFQPKARRQEWFARCVVGLFRALGATFVKVGQIMSTRPDLFPPHVIHALEALQDNVGPFAVRARAADVRRGVRQAARGAVRRDLAGADRVGVGGAGAQGAHEGRAHRRGQGAAAEPRRAGRASI